ncbi:hypothetical protein [Streptomyces gobiensis]|uniref:hypothetical protein n=1 Tax=Streptomyces gobiensis TaxID=2875706 RepID=UPI001E6171B5|nr:hypothetical protein [Streptomyces gobiensis]UGY93185.1 hypothetical protein test1122_16665 [Streptomyces gobiensis]
MNRHRFEPARLVLGLALLMIAAGFLLRAGGRVAVSYHVLVLLLPVALLLGGVTAGTAYLVRRRRGLP